MKYGTVLKQKINRKFSLFKNKIINSKVRCFSILTTFHSTLTCRTKNFEFPVEIDFDNEKAFNATQYTFLFQKFLRIRFFNIEVRFFGTAIQKRVFIYYFVGCQRHLFYFFYLF